MDEIQTSAAPAEPELSIADHEAQFHGGNLALEPEVAAPVEAPVEAPTEPEPAKGKGRHRAKSAQASPDDVPRIAELTRKLREAERERDEWKTKSAAPPAQPVAPVVRPPAPTATTRPGEDDRNADGSAKYKTYADYVEALSDWKYEQRRAAERAQETQEREQSRLATSWKSRVDDAKTAHDDFEQVALLQPTKIPAGSVVDAWILEHKAGAHVLYHLQKNPDELDALLKQPLFEQVDTLSLLGQRLLNPPRTPAAVTGAVATPRVASVPRPPTPVRTAPQRVAGEPPGEEASVAEHESYYGRRRR